MSVTRPCRPVVRYVHIGVFAIAAAACSQTPDRHSTTDRSTTESRAGGHALGAVDFPVSCSPEARAEFTYAVTLLHHMTYPQARTAFQKVATTDPRCAMAQWGIAMTLFQPLWPTRPGPAALKEGWEAVQKAKALHPSTARESLFVASAEAFYLDPDSSDYWLRIRRWEQATQRHYAADSNDMEASAFYALAHLATTPSDSITRSHADRSAEILLRILKRNPNHPGAMHYLVHANDVPGREQESIDVLRTYVRIAPDNPHALHMPTHIYTRLGAWNNVIDGNTKAASAALKYPAGAHGEYVWDEFCHAIEYIVYAQLQKGVDDSAAAQIARLRTTPKLEPTFKTAFHLASTQARYALERHAWDEAVHFAPQDSTTVAWNRFPWPEAVAQFARGMGAARTGKIDDANVAAARIEALETATRNGKEVLFARHIEMLHLELNAWIAHARGNTPEAVALMRRAVALETSTPKPAVTPAPTLPAYEQLGDLLTEQKKPKEALAAYHASLARYPHRFNSLLGAARAANALGDSSQARTYYKELLEVAPNGTRQPAMNEARSFVVRR